MKKLWLLAMIAVAIGIVFFSAHSAWARKQYETEFKLTYYKPDSADANEKKLADAIDKITTGEPENRQSCVICHFAASKKKHNDYGKAMNVLLDMKDKDNPEKIQAALKKVGEQKSPSGPTYGELLGKGELPGEEPK